MKACLLSTLVLLALASSACFAAKTGEYGKDCKKMNDCADDKQHPLCRTIPDGDDDTKDVCVECDPADGDLATCPAGYFCVQEDFKKDEEMGYKEDALYATCQKRADPVGKRCDASVTTVNLEKGTNDELFCGYVSRWCKDNDDTPECLGLNEDQPAVVQWVGACVENKCYECSWENHPYSGAGVAAMAIANGKMCWNYGSEGLGGSETTYRDSSSMLSLNQNAFAQMILVVLIFALSITCCMAYKRFT